MSWLIYLSKLIGQPALPRVQMKSGHASHYLVKPVQGADQITQKDMEVFADQEAVEDHLSKTFSSPTTDCVYLSVEHF